MEAMDFMDPKRRLKHTVMLVIGYVLVGIALILLTTILVFVAYGFGLKDGRVIQSGLVFFSSTPNPAHIYIDGVQYRSDTNTKAVLQEGTYHVAFKRDGYRDWNRVITVVGGQVQSFAYPFLFPDNLTTSTVSNYQGVPVLATESLDQRWLLVAQPASYAAFDVYDLSDAKKAPTPLALPASLLTPAKSAQALDVVAWAGDNTHVLLRHTYDAKTEYILLDRSSPEQSVNVSRALALPVAGVDLQLINSHYDQYYLLNTATHDLSQVSLGAPAPKLYVKNALVYAGNGDRTVLYATPDPLDAKKVSINLFDGNTTYTIRHDNAETTCLLALANYSGDLYVAISAPSENVAYVYKNPAAQLSNAQLGTAIPVQVMRLSAPNHLAFSSSGQYLVLENGSKLASYDVDSDLGYTYTLPDTLDTPQASVSWMDGARLAYITNGQVVAMDYDGQNRQALASADPRYPLYFTQSDKAMYTLVPAADKAHELLTSTSLRTLADQ